MAEYERELRTMPKFETPMTFDEFRRSHGETLDAQREHLRDDAVATRILRESGNKLLEWIPWGDAYVTAAR